MSAPIDELVEQLRSNLNERRRATADRVSRIHEACDRYLRAIDEDIAVEAARNHQLKRPSPGGADPATAARALLSLVSALPELVPDAPLADRSETAEVIATSARHGSAVAPVRPAAVRPSESTVVDRKHLRNAVVNRPLVIVGGVGRGESREAIEHRLPTNTEWIDTMKDGFRAIGNLGSRIKGGRIAALILLEGSLGHKHTDPLTSAARSGKVPFTYGNKGGTASIERALDELEKMLARKRD